jgi:hypothetical protein
MFYLTEEQVKTFFPGALGNQLIADFKAYKRKTEKQVKAFFPNANYKAHTEEMKKLKAQFEGMNDAELQQAIDDRNTGWQFLSLATAEALLLVMAERGFPKPDENSRLGKTLRILNY